VKRPRPLVIAVGVVLVLGAFGFAMALKAAFAPRPPKQPRVAEQKRVTEPTKGSQRVEAPRRSVRERVRARARETIDGWAVGQALRFRQPTRPEPAERIVASLADGDLTRLPAEGAPKGWILKEFSGKASVELVRTEPGLALKLRSDGTSFALLRELAVDLTVTPVLSWTWKVNRLPSGGDVRKRTSDDEAAQVYVVFPRWPSPTKRSDVIGYVWDTQAPVGTVLTSTKAPNVKIVVVESGASRVGEWQAQSRNVRNDYVALFGSQPLRVGAVAVMTDADDTRGTAEALVTGLAFSRGPS
jgi:hypothetical protein